MYTVNSSIRTAYLMPLQTLDTPDIFETKLTEVDFRFTGQLNGVWWKVPGSYTVAPKDDHLNVLDTGDDVIMVLICHHTSGLSGCIHIQDVQGILET